VPGELADGDMGARLETLGPVDILCTHVAPAIPPLQKDVVGGMSKGSPAVLAYIERHQPRFHYFGDVHQPQATQWWVGETLCRNVGYFRATGRGLHHQAA
jgi:Icc-related predicted phosphoesterase